MAVVIQNGGTGAAYAAPIASLMVEKYLTDTLRTERLKEVDRLAGTNLLPFYLPRLQYKEDSLRARRWFKMTNDSNYIRKYTTRR
ncbi:hypothetical protein [Paraflavitalea speifideaquila]|uniref:hypothetical protein n=1 Tax=Paraflavitalea speifideaquila TaxID=3076558 RepID=UPI0028EB016F|nr:hypothetical protein [Paraflavitalea speifideiaquila]